MNILTEDVRVLSTGLVRKAGKSVGKSEVPPALWNQWIESGILIEGTEEDLILAPKPMVEPLKTAVEEDMERGEKVKEDIPYSNLTTERLREIAKERNIEKYWLKKKETLVTELNRLGV